MTAAVAAGLLGLSPASAATGVAPSSADAARARQDLSVYCTYAAASTGIRSEHPQWYASLCRGATTQPEAAALRSCYLDVAARHPVSGTCLSDVRSGAVWARLDPVESGSGAAAATVGTPHWRRSVHVTPRRHHLTSRAR